MNSTLSNNAACTPGADSAFGPAVHGCCDGFDFTLAFEQYFFSIAPASIMLLLVPWRLLSLRNNGRGVVVVAGGNAWRNGKLVAITLFAATQLALLISWSTSHTAARSPAIAGSTLSFIASLLFIALSYQEHTRSPSPSALLNGYLLLSLLLDAAVLRTLWLSPFPASVRGCFTAGVCAKAIVMLLEAKDKERYLTRDRKTPEETSGLYSQGLFWWLNGFIRMGFRKVLGLDDLWEVDEGICADTLNKEFWKVWDRSTRKKHKLSLVMLSMLRWQLLSSVLPRLVLLALTFAQPFLVTRFLSYLSDPDAPANIGYGIIGAYGLVYFGMAVSSGFYWHRDTRTLAMLRGALIAAIYTKTTRSSITTLDNAAAVTLMSADVETIVRGLREIHELWASIIQIGIATWLLSRQLGPACVAPVFVAVVSALTTIYMSGKTQSRQKKWLKMIHKRIGITSSMIGHIKGIKMSGLTHRLHALIASLRVDEVRSSQSFRSLGTFTATLASVPMMISPVLTFAVFAIVAHREHKALDATRLFTSLSLLLLLSQPLFSAFEGILTFRSSLGCFERIGKFLEEESRVDPRLDLYPGESPSPSLNDGEKYIPPTNPVLPKDTEVIRVTDGAFGWKKDGEATLSDINLSIKAGDLTLLIGPVASGKSTLLKALLGETPSSDGTVRVASREIAWCEQTPWLINASVQKNIIGFKPFDSELYKTVLHCCDLEEDIALLPDGDKTNVGSKGITLSGGQKQRVAMARAVYAATSIAVFDDVFSGLDARTSNNVFRRLFGPDGLYRKRGTTVIVATHAVNLLPWADHIVALSSEGKITEQGTLEELNKRNGYVRSFYLEHEVELQEEDDKSVSSAGEEKIAYKPEVPVKFQDERKEDKPKGGKDARQLGDFSVYAYYFNIVGWKQGAVFFFLEAAYSFFLAFPTVWLKWWTDANAAGNNRETGKYLGVYSALQVVGLMFSAAMVWFTFQKMTATSGIKLHNVILKTVMSAPMSFFSKTDTGSITNRFSQDMQLIDHALPLSLMCVVNYGLVSIAHVILIATASPWIALSFPFLFFVFWCIQSYYLRTSRQLRLLDIEAKAPVYTLFLESLPGLCTIRAFNWSSAKINRMKELLDTAQKPFYLLLMTQRWLTLVLDLVITALAVVVVGIVVALKLHSKDVSVGFTGVALTQIISLAGYVKLTIMFWTTLETSSGAVSRVRSFSKETENEYGNNRGENGDVGEGWPTRGSVEFRNVEAGYKVNGTENKALNDLSLSINAGERVGICGRTGSGKSSLISTLFRLLDPTSGSILVDGTDISSLPLETVRSGVTCIPQESYFIAGTVRLNIDPYATAASDSKILSALEKVNLLNAIEKMGGLDAELDPENLSHGQRQLFCLARAVLRGGRILVIDEATSSVDRKTDEVMQAVIREMWPKEKCTIIAVAHRLETIVDFDRVAVLDGGKLVEWDSPAVLLGKEAGRFRELYAMSALKTREEEEQGNGDIVPDIEQGK